MPASSAASGQVRLGRFAKAVDAERAAPAKVDIVGVILENRFLGKLLLQLEGDDHLRQLARPALACIQPEHACELLAESGGALGVAAFLEVDVSGFHDADGVETGVLEKALIFGRCNGMDQHCGDVREPHHAAFLAVGPGDVGDQLRLELILAAGGVVLERNDLRDPAAGELDDAGLLVEVGFRAGEHFDGIRLQQVVAGGIAARFVVAAAAQLGGDAGGRGGFAHGHRFRSGEDLGRIGERADAQLLVDEPRILGVIVGECAQPQDHEEGEPDHQEAAYGSQKEPGQAGAFGYAELHVLLGRSFRH
jgi:hypothetical protein